MRADVGLPIFQRCGKSHVFAEDISELTEDTGFVPEYEFERGIRELMVWWRERK